MKLVKQDNRKDGGKNRLMKDRRGLSTVEYVIILALIAIASIGAWTEFGDSVMRKTRAEAGQVDKLVDEPQ